MNFSSINIQGGILSSEILNKIAADELRHLDPASFGLPKNITLRDEIGFAWSSAQANWKVFQLRRERISTDETGTSETRQHWLLPFLQQLGYNPEVSNAEIINEKSYAISHRDRSRERLPLHLVGVNQKLDDKPDKGTRLSPHGLMQEYLNNCEHLYGLISNGRQLRLLRDSSRLTRLAYLEFDLERMMEDGLYAEFAILYRVLHASRLPKRQDASSEAIIEYYHQESIASGSRIREKLSKSVIAALEIVSNGLLNHPSNQELRDRIRSGQLTSDAFFKELLRFVYRLLFLLVVEDRQLLYPAQAKDETLRLRDIYLKFYSLQRLVKLARSTVYVDARKTDLWQALITTFEIFEDDKKAQKLGLRALGSGIFSRSAIKSIKHADIDNRALINVLRLLTSMENEQKQRVNVNYADLDVEEFGSVYEGLLDIHPHFEVEEVAIRLNLKGGTDRKETGSYYTNHDLVAQLVKSALDPVIEQKMAGAERATSGERDPTRAKQLREEALLSITVCDPACGSGHFLLAAARRIALRLAQVRSGEENPGLSHRMEAMRSVIQRCIYGVDKNPAAVELCKVALWIEGYSIGKPLSFLDHHIRPGDSLVGLDTTARLLGGIPDDAYKPVSGDDKSVATAIKKKNKAFTTSKQYDLFTGRMEEANKFEDFAVALKTLNYKEGKTIDEVNQQAASYEEFRNSKSWQRLKGACNLYVYAFFQPLTEDNQENLVDTDYLDLYIQGSSSLNYRASHTAEALAETEHFFHWPLEFPDIDFDGGFDVMLGNPPWERIKLQEKEFFQARSKEVMEAPNAAARKKVIEALKETQPKLFSEYQHALHVSESSSKFIRSSGRFILTGNGDINTYSVFSELILNGINEKGQAGFIVPTGIATDDTNKHFFSYLVESDRLVSLFDFENKKAIFENVHRSYKFSLLTLGAPQPSRQTTFGFFLHDVLDLNDVRRVFALSKHDFLNINPNTKTTPIFRTRQDAELTAKIYSRVPVLVNEEKNQNPWGISFMRMFDMSNDSHLFRTREEMEAAGFTLMGNRFVKGDERWLPLYESKMIWHYDHRYGSYAGVDSRTSTQTPTPSLEQYQDPNYQIMPWYWVAEREVLRKTKRNWFSGFRRITNVTNERTFVNAVTPMAAFGDNLFLFEIEGQAKPNSVLNSMMSSLVFDYIVRQKLAGMNMNFFYVQQFPLLSYQAIKLPTEALAAIFELIYNSADLRCFADDFWAELDAAEKEELEKLCGKHISTRAAVNEISNIQSLPQNRGCPLPPFKWDENRRAELRAELDAWFALLYGLERDELRYILDPKDVHGPDFPGETFRVMQEKEIKKYGEYRTQRLVLAAYDRLRPTFDMEAHLKRLQEVWEECQVDLTVKKEKSKASTKQSKPTDNKSGKLF